MATVKQKKALDILAGNGGSVGAAMREAGYSAVTADTPKKLTESKAFKEIFGEYITDEDLAQKHKELLNASRLDHMTFPMGPQTEKEKKVLDAMDVEKPIKSILEAEQALQRTDLTDDDIVAMLRELNCTVRRIVHGQTARHVYFWSADNKARKDALDMAYKHRGAYAPEKSVSIVATVDLNAPMDEQAALAKEYEEKLRDKMLNGNTTGTNFDSRLATAEQDQEREGGTD